MVTSCGAPQSEGITNWLRGKTIFITGASGFVGKVLVIKLLTACPEIGRIFLLLRPKKGKCSSDRLEELISLPIFESVKSRYPEAIRKIQVIEGDMTKKYIGINENDRHLLKETVEVVFNAAASIRFDDTLQKAIQTNTRSAFYLIGLAKEMERLQVFLHVSTAFTNSNYKFIPEKVLPLNFDWKKVIAASEMFSEYELDIYSSKILGTCPNTYIFTKKIAETIVHENRDKIPIVIYRPAVVSSASQEPKPGWCDTLNSIAVLSGATAKGVLRVTYGDSRAKVSYITVDACVNGMIIAAWHRSRHPLHSTKVSDCPHIYNAVDLMVSMKWMVDFGRTLEFEYPSSNALWRMVCILCANRFKFQLLTILLHVIPGCIIDQILILMKKKPLLGRIYRKLYSTSFALHYFMSNTFDMENENFQNLINLVPEQEKSKFYTNSLHGYSSAYELALKSYMGIRRLLGDEEELSQSAKNHAERLYWIDMVSRTLLVCLIIWILPIKYAFDVILTKFESYRELLL